MKYQSSRWIHWYQIQWCDKKCLYRVLSQRKMYQCLAEKRPMMLSSHLIHVHVISLLYYQWSHLKLSSNQIIWIKPDMSRLGVCWISFSVSKLQVELKVGRKSFFWTSLNTSFSLRLILLNVTHDTGWRAPGGGILK